VLLNGQVSDVERACQQAIEPGVQILSPECAVPLSTPIENLCAVAACAAGVRYG